MHQQTPVLFNHHQPLEVNASALDFVNLNTVYATKEGLRERERVLLVTPLRNAAWYLPKYFELIAQLEYPHELIDLAFLVSDSTDDTMAVLAAELDRVQNNPDPHTKGPFRSGMIVSKDFGMTESQDVEYRHSFEYQGPRRKALGKARNFLLYTALKPEHSWVYWRDVDIKESPKTVIEDLIWHDHDIIVPSM